MRTRSRQFVMVPNDFLERAVQAEWPEPIEPLYDITELPDPPTDWRLLGESQKDIYSGLTIPVLNVLFEHHLWGIKCFEYAGKPTKKEKTLAIRKYFYHMQDRHRPQSWDEVFALTRDAGPRLLKWSLNPTPPPVSRFYPELPPRTSEKLGARKDWVPPQDTPTDMPRTYSLQFQLPVNEPVERPWAPIPDKRSGSEKDGNRPGTSSGDPPTRKKRKLGEVVASRGSSSPMSVSPPGRSTRSRSRMSGSRQGPSEPNAPGQNSPGQSPPSQDPSTGVTLHYGTPSPGGPAPFTPPPALDDSPVREAIERAIMNYTYRWLDRHHSAPYKGPIAHRIAEKADDLAIVQSGAFQSIKAAKINMYLQLDADPNAFTFPVRGRGPIWAGTSCAVDCVIVLGSLLDAGCTVADRDGTNGERLSDLEKAFVEVTNMNWEAFSEETSRELRDSFYRILCDHVPSMTIGTNCHSWVPWSECTKNFAQFKFEYTTVTNECHCKGSDISEYPGVGRVMDPHFEPEDREGVTLNQLWLRSFPIYRPYYCQSCGAGPENDGPSLFRKIDQLPLRLVVQTEPGTKIWQHTKDHVFDYADSQGDVRQVAYRWLGGIYQMGTHARVFWNESKRFEAPTKDYAMYDGALASGMILAFPAFSDQDENIPLEWVHDPCGPPILVYERVMNPESSTLWTAVNTLDQMGRMVDENHLFQYAHIPWNPLPGPPEFNDKPRQLPSFGDRFLDSKRPDPFDTLPANFADVKLPDWLSLINIDPTRNLMDRYTSEEVLAASQIPADVLNTAPPPCPEDVAKFNSPHVGPQSLAGRPELWVPGTLDVTGALDFPDLSSRSNSARQSERTKSGSRSGTGTGSNSNRPSSGSSSGGNSPEGARPRIRPYTLGAYFKALLESPNPTSKGKGRAKSNSPRTRAAGATAAGFEEENVSMGEAPPLSPATEEDIFKTFTYLSSHRGEPGPRVVNIYPKMKRPMREQVLINNAKQATKVTKMTKATNATKAIGKRKDVRSKKNRAKTPNKQVMSKPKEVKF